MSAIDILSIFLLIFAAFSFYRVLKGPRAYDRLLGLNVIAVIVTIIFITYSVERDMGFLLDLALVFLVLNFVATLGFAKYLERGEFR